MLKDKWNEQQTGFGIRSLQAVTTRMMCEKCGVMRKFFGLHEPSLNKGYLICTECKHKKVVRGD